MEGLGVFRWAQEEDCQLASSSQWCGCQRDEQARLADLILDHSQRKCTRPPSNLMRRPRQTSPGHIVTTRYQLCTYSTTILNGSRQGHLDDFYFYCFAAWRRVRNRRMAYFQEREKASPAVLIYLSLFLECWHYTRKVGWSLVNGVF